MPWTAFAPTCRIDWRRHGERAKDGEDLEGDPVEVATSCAANGITIHVVAVGGRAPQPIPNVGEDGVAHGFVTDETGALHAGLPAYVRLVPTAVAGRAGAP